MPEKVTFDGLVITNLFLIFLVIISFVFIVLYTFHPPLFQYIKDGHIEPEIDAPGDPVMCFVGSIIISLIIIFILWMIHSCSDQKILSSSSQINATNIFIIFLIIISFIYIILFTFKPKPLLYIEKGEIEAKIEAPVDPAKCFVVALVLSLIVILIIWMFKMSE